MSQVFGLLHTVDVNCRAVDRCKMPWTGTRSLRLAWRFRTQPKQRPSHETSNLAAVLLGTFQGEGSPGTVTAARV